VLDRYPEELAQTCVYAFGMLAQHGGAHFDGTTTKALGVLQKALTDKVPFVPNTLVHRLSGIV
jgi:hypothetical protein